MKLSYRKGDEQDPLKYHLVFVEEVTATGQWISGDCLRGVHEVYREFIPFGDERIQEYWNPRE